MAFSRQKAQAQIGTTATNIFDVGSIHINNVNPDTKQFYLSIVPTGQTMTSGNSIIWNASIGGSGFISICQPMFLASGDKLQASGSSIGLNLYSSYVKYN